MLKGRDMAESAGPLDVDHLVVDHHQALYRYAYRLSGSAADAEDLTQQVFLTAQQKIDQVRSADCARGWLFTVLRNCYLKSRRQRRPLSAGSMDLDVNSIPAQTVPAIDREALQRAINSLDDQFKTVLLAFYFEHRSYREIAEILDIPPGTVMSRLSRAKAHLRNQLTAAVEPPSRQPEPTPIRRELPGVSPAAR
jgi:RNA polymerase sigma-70 factor (ECF subfamily)